MWKTPRFNFYPSQVVATHFFFGIFAPIYLGKMISNLTCAFFFRWVCSTTNYTHHNISSTQNTRSFKHTHYNHDSLLKVGCLQPPTPPKGCSTGSAASHVFSKTRRAELWFLLRRSSTFTTTESTSTGLCLGGLGGWDPGILGVTWLLDHHPPPWRNAIKIRQFLRSI